MSKSVQSILLLSFLACSQVMGADRAAIRVGLAPHEPVVIVSRDGKSASGIVPEILGSIADVKGWKLEFVTGSMPDILRGLEQGTLDLAAPIAYPASQTSARIDVLKTGLVASWGIVYVSKSSRLQTPAEFSGRNLAVVRGDPHLGNLKSLFSSAGVRCDLIEMQRYDQVLEAIQRRQVDGGLVDAYYGERYAHGYKVRATPVVTTTVEFRMAASLSGKAAVSESLEHWVSVYRMNPNSPYHKAIARWTKPVRPYRVLLYVVVLLVAVAGTVGLLMTLRRIRDSLATRAERLDARNRQLERTLEEEEQREKSLGVWRDWYRTLLNRSHDAILVYGLDENGRGGKYVEANDTACAILAYSREELLTLTPGDIEVGNSGRPLHADLTEPKRSPDQTGLSVVERVFRSKAGREFPVEVTVRMLTFEGRPVIMCAAQDITQRRNALWALRESERRFQDFFARSPIGVAIYNAAQELTDVNQSALAMFGMSDRGQFARLDLLHAPDFTEEFRRELLKGGTVRFELDFNCDDEPRKRNLSILRSGICRFDVFATNLGLDQSFDPKGFLVQIQDVTERHRAEEALRQNERILRQAQKMEAIGTLAGGIAHDFNNILTPIIGYAEMGMLDAPPDSSAKTILSEILKGSHRARDLVRQILAFSRQTDNEAKPVRLGEIVAEVRTLLHGSIPKNVELRCRDEGGQDIVLANATQLHQVVMNLCANGLHAMRDKGGLLDLSLASIEVTKRTKGPLSRLRPGNYVELTVRDTGVGMDKKTQERIFEPFFTTKRSGEGTGMGLAVVHGIVTALNGIIHVDSEPGKGSAFHIILPIVAQSIDQVGAQGDMPPKGVGTVLFVDDEGDIVAMVQQMLVGLGYSPSVSRSAADALATFRADPSRFDLVITDQMMPDMTGIELAREMRKLRRDVPFILCTGFSKAVSKADLEECGIQEVLMKPILLRQMADAIQRVLKDRAPKPS